jgi:hypothetical protein
MNLPRLLSLNSGFSTYTRGVLLPWALANASAEADGYISGQSAMSNLYSRGIVAAGFSRRNTSTDVDNDYISIGNTDNFRIPS